jgi:ubiquinone/menaquinone biosynthesis C-methylase UbiE
MTKHEVGHTFLARLGKKRLRPGGIKATNWLIEQANLNENKKVLEVACNMCTTSMELAKIYGCHITAVDMDPRVLEKARHNIAVNNLEDKITLQQANAMKLPFEKETFDVVFNEAMLTMLNGKSKQKAISEYYRVLKPGGILLTHDVMLAKEDMADTIESLRKTIHVNVEPLTLKGWQQVFKEEGFVVSTSHGDMTLMSPKGMIRDEGLLGTLKIIRNGLKKENRSMFKKMYSFFNHPDVKMEYIAVASRK